MDVDLLLFDAYLEGFKAMPLDLCFGSRLPTLEQVTMGHSASQLQEFYEYKHIELPEDLQMEDMEMN